MGPVTLDAIRALLSLPRGPPGGFLLASATDANAAGDRYAARHAELAAASHRRRLRTIAPGRRHRLERRDQKGEGAMNRDRAWIRFPKSDDGSVCSTPTPGYGPTRTYRSVCCAPTAGAGYSAWDLPRSVALHSLTVLTPLPRGSWRDPTSVRCRCAARTAARRGRSADGLGNSLRL